MVLSVAFGAFMKKRDPNYKAKERLDGVPRALSPVVRHFQVIKE